MIGPAFGGVPSELNGGVPVNVQDQTSPLFDYYFAVRVGDATTLTADSAVDDTVINVTSVDNISVGSDLMLQAGTPNTPRVYFGKVLAVDTLAVTLDTPLDHAFTQANARVVTIQKNLNVDGATTPVVCKIGGPSSDVAAAIDITRLMIVVETDTAVNLNDFGDLAPLEKGVVLRKTDGTTYNIWNIKTNSGFAAHAFDFDVYEASNPSQGVNGFTCRYTFAGQSKHGVAVRLSQGESLELLVQDDLTDLLTFNIIAQGHYVAD